ncbi:MAG: pirin family protein, partial [Pseudomonadota bacterium]
PVHFLQIWIIPEADGIAPSYEQKSIPLTERAGALRLLGSRDGRDGSIVIHRDVDLYGSVLAKGEAVTHAIGSGRGVWVQMIRGAVFANGDRLEAGDGLALIDETSLRIEAEDDAEFLLFDMAL